MLYTAVEKILMSHSVKPLTHVSPGDIVTANIDYAGMHEGFDARKYEQALKDSWLWFIEHGFKAPDMDAMNLAFLHHEMYHMIVKLAGVQWLGTNEQMLKPYMKACKRSDGLLWTDSGLEIWSVHGHYYHEKWRTQQLLNRKGCIKGRLDGSEKAYGDAAGALDVLYRAFLDALNGTITVEHKDYRCG